MRGLLVVNKAKGWTSFDVVNYCKHALHTREVGHLGTLDPMATGVLVVTIGSATKLFDMFLNKTKKYIAKFEFGYSTDTLDADGVVEQALNGLNLAQTTRNSTKQGYCSPSIENGSQSAEKVTGQTSSNLTNSGCDFLQNTKRCSQPVDRALDAELAPNSQVLAMGGLGGQGGAVLEKNLSDKNIQPKLIDGQIPNINQITDILPMFIGEIEQMPPKYSAKKIQGRKACDLARAGKEVELKPAKVRIESLKILDYSNNVLTLEIVCGAGTYIRSLGRDIALKLNSLATMIELNRTEVGNFKLGNSINIKAQDINLQDHILPIDSVFYSLPTLDNVDDIKRLTNGQTLVRAVADGEYRMYLDGEFVGLATAKNNHIKMSKYFKL